MRRRKLMCKIWSEHCRAPHFSARINCEWIHSRNSIRRLRNGGSFSTTGCLVWLCAYTENALCSLCWFIKMNLTNSLENYNVSSFQFYRVWRTHLLSSSRNHYLSGTHTNTHPPFHKGMDPWRLLFCLLCILKLVRQGMFSTGILRRLDRNLTKKTLLHIKHSNHYTRIRSVFEQKT